MQVAAAEKHKLVLLASGTVLSYGTGFYGVGRRRTVYVDSYLSDLDCKPEPITALRHHIIVAVAAGEEHSLVLNARGQLLTFGNGYDGRLGHGPDCTERVAPCVVKALKGVRICHISAGSAHSIVLSTTGQAYTFGYGDNGCLGLGDEEKCAVVPTLVEGLVGHHIVSASAGTYHTLALQDNGVVWSFGDGEVGNLGHNNCEHRYLPAPITACQGVHHVVGVSAGLHHSAVWTDRGQLLTFGLADTGLFGMTHTQDCVCVPTVVPRLIVHHVVEVSAGNMFTLVRTRGDRTFGFGPGLDAGINELVPTVQRVTTAATESTTATTSALASDREYDFVANDFNF